MLAVQPIAASQYDHARKPADRADTTLQCRCTALAVSQAVLQIVFVSQPQNARVGLSAPDTQWWPVRSSSGLAHCDKVTSLRQHTATPFICGCLVIIVLGAHLPCLASACCRPPHQMCGVNWSWCAGTAGSACNGCWISSRLQLQVSAAVSAPASSPRLTATMHQIHHATLNCRCNLHCPTVVCWLPKCKALRHFGAWTKMHVVIIGPAGNGITAVPQLLGSAKHHHNGSVAQQCVFLLKAAAVMRMGMPVSTVL